MSLVGRIGLGILLRRLQLRCKLLLRNFRGSRGLSTRAETSLVLDLRAWQLLPRLDDADVRWARLDDALDCIALCFVEPVPTNLQRAAHAKSLAQRDVPLVIVDEETLLSGPTIAPLETLNELRLPPR